MKYIISENQMVKLVSKLTKTDADNGFLSKLQTYLGNDDEVIGEVILKAIDEGKSKVNDYEEGDLWQLQKIAFTVGKLPMEIMKHATIMSRYGKWHYELNIDILGEKGLKISSSLLKKIFDKLYNQYKGLSESKTEIENPESSEPGYKKQIKKLIETKGLYFAAELVGGLKNLIDSVFDSDYKKFCKETGFSLVNFSSDQQNLNIHKVLADTLPVKELFNGDKELGKFRFGPKNDVGYAFTAVLMPTLKRGEPYYRVVGRSGDSGFGYSDILKKHILGKRYRQQIFNQILDKYDLRDYLNI